MERKTITINGNKFSDLEGFYNEIDRVLTHELDWQTGHNMAAFNDLLRGGFGVHEYEEPIKIIWTHSNKNKEELGWAATIKFIGDTLKTCHPTNIPQVKEDLELAKQHNGKTLFESIVEMIKEHEHIELSMMGCTTNCTKSSIVEFLSAQCSCVQRRIANQS